MGKIHAMMDIGKRSMMNSQTSLQTVSHNIANKGTEGYSRQRVDTVTAAPVSEGRLQIGMGSRASQVNRINNPFLERQLQKESSTLGYFEGQSEMLTRVEHVFNEQVNKGLNSYISEFFNAFRELSNNPESITSRTIVKEAAESMSRDFARVDKQLRDIQTDIDFQIRGQVQEINKMTKEIADLNQQIVTTEMQGIPANDQRDRRDLLIQKLNEKIDIRFAEGDKGAVTVTTAGNALLVSGNDNSELVVGTSPVTQRASILFKPTATAEPFDITSRIQSGELGGVLQVRDKVVEDSRNQIHTLARTLVTEVNRVHSQGYDRIGRPAGEFFITIKDDDQNPSQQLRLAEDIKSNVGRIATAAQPNAPGDATIANTISMIQYRQIMDDGKATIDDYYNSQVGQIGVLTQTSRSSKEAQDNIMTQMRNLRESISGVNLDEEATKMIEFQKTFDASARLIRTADEMFETVLSLKRI